MTAGGVSTRASYYLHKAGVAVPRPGSHSLRHTCVQRLIDAHFPLKTIGDYVGHGSPESTAIYAKVSNRRIEFRASMVCDNTHDKFFSDFRQQHITAQAQEQIQGLIIAIETFRRWSLELINLTECVRNDDKDQILARNKMIPETNNFTGHALPRLKNRLWWTGNVSAISTHCLAWCPRKVPIQVQAKSTLRLSPGSPYLLDLGPDLP
jgi:hypothetical protein